MAKQKKLPVIIDCGPGHDDGMAILMKEPEPGAENLFLCRYYSKIILHKM